MEFEYEAIFCIVNAGFSDAVMDAAKELGARGGTVIHARGTANSDAEKLYQITIQPEKEIVMIIARATEADAILEGLYRVVGTSSNAEGVVFALPVDEALGFSGIKE